MTVTLTSKPTADVTIALTPDAQVTTTPASITVHPADWATGVTFDVAAVDDGFIEGAHHGTIGAAGCSFGAYHAVNFALRHPEIVRRAMGLSGIYDIQHLDQVDEEPAWPAGYTDDTVAAHDPCHYVPREQGAARLEAWRGMDLWLSTGCRDGGASSHHRLSEALYRHDVAHTLTWVRGVAHEWSSWRELLGRRLGG